MYEEYYGFVQPPFSLTPDPRFLYRSESHDVALQQVWQAIRRKEGFIVLTGDIGTGKTTLCRTILEQFDRTTFTALVLNPFLSIEELLRDVLVSYGVASKDALRTGRLATASKHELIRTLHDFLLALVPIHGSAVLIIDEAQHLSPEVLEEIRILSNLETNERKLLQIVLVGQLNLLDALQDAKLRQLDQRVSIRCWLKPLNREEVEAYITHRLWVARGSTTLTFTPKAVDVVHAISGGVPRMINLICDRALMLACEARTSQVTDTFIVNGAAALGLTPPASDRARRGAGRPFRVAVVVLLIGLLALAGAAYYALGNPFELMTATERPTVSTPPPQSLGVRPVAVNTGLDALPSLTIPTFAEDSPYSVLVGTYDSPSQAAAAEAALRTRALPLYAIDLRYEDGTRRRLVVGRYATREEADKVRDDLARDFAAARVVYAWNERVR